MVNRTTRMILAVALAAPIAALLAQTNGLPRPIYVVSNAYVEIRSSQPLWRNGGLDFLTVTNAAPPLDMVVAPMPGWELLTPPELHITDGHAGMWSVRGVLGETHAGGEMCIPMTTSNDTHRVAPSFKLPPPSTGSGGSGPSAESLPPISSGGPYVVASTSDTAKVSFSCAPTDLTNGVHEAKIAHDTCPGGKTNWHTEQKGDYNTSLDTFAWTWSCGGTNGVQDGRELNVGPLELHAGAHKVSAELEARYSGCDKCVYTETAETNIVVSLLTVTCDPWIGLDRTGDPATPYESSNVTARASLDPANPGVAKVEWTYAGVCDRTEKRDWEMDVWTTSREKCSGSYLEERVTAAACGASASTNFTVVKVDVEINGLDETAEEAVGAYLAYVADTNGVMTAAGTNAMAGVKFTCEPANLPPDEMVTIANSGHGELYLREGEALYLVTTTNIPAREIATKDFLLHGHKASGAVLKDEITIEHPSSKARDLAKYTVVKAIVREVSFSDGNTTLVSDDQSVTFSAPHYLDVNEDGDANDHGERSYPISYVRGTSMVVAAKFTVSPKMSGGTAKVKADVTSGANLPATNATISGNSVLLPPSRTEKLPDLIASLKPMTMQWQVSFDGGGTWLDAGASTNTLYVTWARPVSSPHIHTYFDVGCGAASGTTGVVGENDDTVLQRIWAKFQTKAISRASDGRVLTYYGFYDVNGNGVWDEGIDKHRNLPATCPFSSAAELVRETNGQCHSWAEFMYQVLCANGLKFINGHQTLFVLVISSSGQSANTAIKNWEKLGPGPWQVAGGDAGMTGEDVFKDLKEPFAQDIAGVAAQGNSPNPPSRFSNHWIINAAALFYDPSYGIGPVDNTYKYERAAFEGRIQREILYNLPKNGVINSYLLTSSLE